MLKIDDDYNIWLTRGDTARLHITIKNKDKTTYEINPNDTLRLTVKKSYKLPEHLFQKVVQGTNIFDIKPEDTNHVQFGRYVYDVEITTASGEVYTIIGYDPTKGDRKFEIMKEATWQ